MAQYTIAPLQIDITASKSNRAGAVRDLVAQVASVTDPDSAGLAMLVRYLIWHESAQATTRVQDAGIARGLIQIQPNRLADTATRYLLGGDALDIAASLAFSASTVPADMTDALIQFQTQTRVWPDLDTRLSDWLSGAVPSPRVASDTFAVLLLRYDFRGNFSGGDPDLSDANACANVWAKWWWRGPEADRPARKAAFLADAADYDASAKAFSRERMFESSSGKIVNRTRRRDLYRGDVIALPAQAIYDGDRIFAGLVSAQNLGWVYTFAGQLLIRKIDDSAPGYLILTLQSQQYTELEPTNIAVTQRLFPSGPTVLYFAAPDDVNWHMDCSLQAISTAIGAWKLDPFSQIAFPYGLILSPRQRLETSVPQPFADALTRISQRLDTAMWHMKLQGTPLPLQPKTDTTAKPPFDDAHVTPGLSKDDIAQIVDSGIDVFVDRMVFGSLGASANVSWQRITPSPSGNLDAYAENTEVGRQSNWKRAPRTVPFPTRHWMSQVSIWKREPAFDDASVGRLVPREYIRLNQATITVDGDAARRLGGKSITLQTPSGSPLTAEIYPQTNPNWTVKHVDGSAVQYAGKDLQVFRYYLLAGRDPATNEPIQGPEVTWQATFGDFDANAIQSAPLAFFYLDPAVASAMDTDSALLQAVSDAYVRDILSPDTGFPINFNRSNAVIADFQDPRNSGDRVTADKVTYELINMVMHAELDTSASGISSWLPAAQTVTVTSPAIRAFLGDPILANAGVTIKFDPKYVADGIYNSVNAAGVFGNVQTVTTPALVQEQTCIAALHGSLKQLSASATNAMSGLIAGEFKIPIGTQFQTLDWSALAPAMVLNLFSLSDLQSNLFPTDVLTVPAYTIIPPKKLATGELPGVQFSLTKLDVPLGPIKLGGLTVAEIASPKLAINATIRNFVGEISQRTVDIQFPAVTVPIPPKETPPIGTVVTLTFGRTDTGIHVTWHADGKIDLDAPLTKIEFNSGLISALSDLAKTIQGQQNPLIDFVTDPHSTLPALLVQLGIHLPDIGLGVFGLRNLALNTRLYYPLAIGKPSVEIDIADAFKQFELSVCMLSGFGFYGMRITGFDASDIDFYGSLDFGASVQISLLGIANGGVSIHAGFYYESGTSELSLDAHLQISGNLSVLFFSVDAYFYLGIGYSNGVYAGEAIFHVEFHVLFASISLDLRCRREFAGTAKSGVMALATGRASDTPAPVITADAYRRYCAAFA